MSQLDIVNVRMPVYIYNTRKRTRRETHTCMHAHTRARTRAHTCTNTTHNTPYTIRSQGHLTVCQHPVDRANYANVQFLLSTHYFPPVPRASYYSAAAPAPLPLAERFSAAEARCKHQQPNKGYACIYIYMSTGVRRMSESLTYSTAWCLMYIRIPYTPA